MECACVYVDRDFEDPYWWCSFDKIPAKRPVECCECGDIITPGELHEKQDICWNYKNKGNFSYSSYRTCESCVSIRDAFFCEGYIFTTILEDLWEHIVNIDGELSEKCLSELTPKARDLVCDLIEELWKLDYGKGED